MILLYAHTSSVWLTNELMTQWYTSLSGLLQLLAWAAQFFLAAASLHFSSLSGHSSTISKVNGDIGQESLEAFDIWKRERDTCIFHAKYDRLKVHEYKLDPLMVPLNSYYVQILFLVCIRKEL